MCKYIENNFFDEKLEHVISGKVDDSHVKEIAEMLEIDDQIDYITRVNNDREVMLLVKYGMKDDQIISVKRGAPLYYHLRELRDRVEEDSTSLLLNATRRAQQAVKNGVMDEYEAVERFLKPVRKVM